MVGNKRVCVCVCVQVQVQVHRMCMRNNISQLTSHYSLPTNQASDKVASLPSNRNHEAVR